MPAEPLLLLFCGGMGGTAVEELLGEALRECALDTLDEALGSGAYAGAIVVADKVAAAALEKRLPRDVRLDVDGAEDFHFGRRLTEVVARFEVERPVYVGTGMPFLKSDELAAVARALTVSANVVVTNNYFSADLAGFVPGSVLETVSIPNNDRVLPMTLVQEGGLTSHPLPRTIANQFDIDTPGELAIIARAGGAGPNLTAWLERQNLDTDRLAKAAWCFTDNKAVVLVSGRVSSDVLQYLQSETASQTRLYSEERGMAAMGRDLSGDARTLLGFHLRAVGAKRFFAELGEMANAAFIDTRPIFAHMGLQPSRPDRFLSDALDPNGIVDPWVREFTAAARAAPIPVVFGGQSLVTAGLQLLAEAAWRDYDKIATDWKAHGRARDR
jgi:hypothetical protein